MPILEVGLLVSGALGLFMDARFGWGALALTGLLLLVL